MVERSRSFLLVGVERRQPLGLERNDLNETLRNELQVNISDPPPPSPAPPKTSQQAACSTGDRHPRNEKHDYTSRERHGPLISKLVYLSKPASEKSRQTDCPPRKF